MVPLARIGFALYYFINGYDFGKIQPEEIVATYKLIYMYILLGLFFLVLISPKPLYDNASIYKRLFLGYLMCIVALSVFQIELIIAIYFSPFRDYYTSPTSNMGISILFISST